MPDSKPNSDSDQNFTVPDAISFGDLQKALQGALKDGGIESVPMPPSSKCLDIDFGALNGVCSLGVAIRSLLMAEAGSLTLAQSVYAAASVLDIVTSGFESLADSAPPENMEQAMVIAAHASLASESAAAINYLLAVVIGGQLHAAGISNDDIRSGKVSCDTLGRLLLGEKTPEALGLEAGAAFEAVGTAAKLGMSPTDA